MKKILFLLLLIPSFAYPYIGPGMGGGLIATLIGLGLAILIAIIGIFYYPLKIIFKKKNKMNKKKIKK